MLNKMPANGTAHHKERDAPGREAWALSGKSPSTNADAKTVDVEDFINAS